MRAPSASATRGDLSPGGVDADGDAALDQPVDNRDHPAQLLRNRYALGARPGRLTADIDDVCALGRQIETMRDGVSRPRTHRRR